VSFLQFENLQTSWDRWQPFMDIDDNFSFFDMFPFSPIKGQESMFIEPAAILPCNIFCGSIETFHTAPESLGAFGNLC
jgi:hypothetical protein